MLKTQKRTRSVKTAQNFRNVAKVLGRHCRENLF